MIYSMVLPEIPIAESLLIGRGLCLERNMWRQNITRLASDIPIATGRRGLKVTFICRDSNKILPNELLVVIFDALVSNELVIDRSGMVDIEPASVHNCSEVKKGEATIIELWELPPRKEGCYSGQLDS